MRRLAFALLFAACNRAPISSEPRALTGCPKAPASSAFGAPERVASGAIVASRLALDDDAIYWIDPGSATIVALEQEPRPNPDGAILSAPKSGGPPTTLLAGVRGPAWLLAGATRLYFATADGEVVALEKSGGAAVTLFSGDRIESLALDETRLFIATRESVVALPLEGGPPVMLASGARWPIQLVLDAGGVYWSTHDDAVLRVAKAGGAIETILSHQGTPTLLAMCEARLYFAEAFPRPALAVAGSDGSLPTVLDPAVSAWEIAADQGGVYAARVDQRIERWLPSGGTPSLLYQADSRAQLGPIAVDDSHVYWAVGFGPNAGEIWRSAK